jgi:hypothetical protein
LLGVTRDHGRWPCDLTRFRENRDSLARFAAVSVADAQVDASRAAFDAGE